MPGGRGVAQKDTVQTKIPLLPYPDVWNVCLH